MRRMVQGFGLALVLLLTTAASGGNGSTSPVASPCLASTPAKMNSGDFAGVEADCARAMQLAPDYWEAYFARGEVYYKMADWRNTIADLSLYLQHFPNDPDSHYNRGMAYAHLGDCKSAIADFNVQLQLQPDDPDGLFARGKCEAMLHDENAARADLVAATVEYNKRHDQAGVDDVTSFMLQYFGESKP